MGPAPVEAVRVLVAMGVTLVPVRLVLPTVGAVVEEDLQILPQQAAPAEPAAPVS
jgi:hypothetical protein